MTRHLCAALAAAVLAVSFAQPAMAEDKKVTPQQQKMKDCAGQVEGREGEQEREGPGRLPQIHERLPERLTRGASCPVGARAEKNRGRRRDVRAANQRGGIHSGEMRARTSYPVVSGMMAGPG